MNIKDFALGLEFYTAAGKWRCTDIGTRVIVAIRVDQVMVTEHDGENETNTTIVLDDQSWFAGPPYAVAEHVFDEFDMGGCNLDPDAFSEMSVVTTPNPK